MSVSHQQLRGASSQGFQALDGFAPGAIYSDAVRIDLPGGGLVLVSGKTGTSNDAIRAGAMKEQTQQVFENIEATLVNEGGALRDIVRMRIFVTEIDSASVRAVHEVRADLFEAGRYPASTLVQVSGFIRPEAKIEIEVDAFIGTTCAS